MLRFIRNWLDRRAVAQASIPAADWDAAFLALPLLQRLQPDEKRRIRELAILFLRHKTITGAHDLEITRHMALIIALQACLPILALGLEHYDGWTSIVVYPSGFAARHVVTDEYGVEHRVRDELSGEAWQRGPVILAWDETEYAGYEDGYNLVIHEFAHKLDMRNGVANGFPPLHREMDIEAWTRAFSAGFEAMQRYCDHGEDIGIDCYAASSPAEFFAVLSETFFERPDILRRRFGAIYEQMKLYYRQDPITRWP
jgi:Mlc titration factor MtfA (ptsG expression regulator)